MDPSAREFLIEKGLNYNHGTGHGVGSFLGVHEGPQSISPLGIQEIKEGMIISNEPGYYKENEYGIRTENLIVVKEKSDGRLFFENISWCPFDRDLIDIDMLNFDELEWLNSYHYKVYQKLKDYLDQKEGIWLKEVTEKLGY